MRLKDDKLTGSFMPTKSSSPFPANGPFGAADPPRLIQLTFDIQITPYGAEGSFHGVIEQRFNSGNASARAPCSNRMAPRWARSGP